MQRRNTGMLGEKFALDYLKKHGYRLIETNYRCSKGEIDIVARHKDSLVFIEVRTKTSLEYGTPEESITSKKRNHMRATAFHYLQAHTNLPQQWRIDVVAIELASNDKPSRIEIIENAVGDD